MPRRLRSVPGNLVYHVLNRANGRARLFDDDADYAAFERVLAQARERTNTRILAYCLMPNHWHLVLWPRRDGELSQFMRWLTVTHTQRWHAHHRTAGSGHLYQGRFKSFPIQQDDHYLTVCRYVERNALRAGLVRRAQDWAFGSLAVRLRKSRDSLLSDGPVALPRNWLAAVNGPQSAAELEQVRVSLKRGAPFGAGPWKARMAGRLGLESTMRPRGRPKREKTDENDS